MSAIRFLLVDQRLTILGPEHERLAAVEPPLVCGLAEMMLLAESASTTIRAATPAGRRKA